VDLQDTPDEAAFRAALSDWLATAVPDELRGYGFGVNTDDLEALRAWSRSLHDAGYAGLTWPTEYGGTGAPLAHQAILLEESARAEAPPHIGVIGLGMAGPTSRASARVRASTATASSSTARRCGRRTRTSPTTASSSPGRTPSPSGTRD
jgi:alkylation response protein AidB-like acyl-CoA dehydrogenase